MFLAVPGELILKLAMAGCAYGPLWVYVLGILVGLLWYKHRVCENGLVLGAAHHPEFSGEALMATHQAGLTDRGLAVCGINTATWEPMFVYWPLGTRSPEKLAAAIEDAMVKAGFDANGLAANALRTAVRGNRRRGNAGEPLLPPLRGPLDRVIGVPRVGGRSVGGAAGVLRGPGHG